MGKLAMLSSFLLLSGLCCIGYAAILFNANQEPTQDVHGLDPAKKQGSWPFFWAGAIQFCLGLVFSLIASTWYAMGRLT